MLYRQRILFDDTEVRETLCAEAVAQHGSLSQQSQRYQAQGHRQHRQKANYRTSLTRCFPTAILRVKRELLGIILILAGI